MHLDPNPLTRTSRTPHPPPPRTAPWAPWLLACAVLAAGAAPAAAHGTLRFDNGLWYDGGSWAKRTVYVVDGVLRDRYDGPVDRMVDLEGRYVIPPLGDAHSHGLSVPAVLEEEVRRFLAAGVFYVSNPNSIARLTRTARERLRGPETPDAIFANGGLTSPGGHPVQIYARLAGRIGWEPEEMAGEAYWEVADREALDRLWPEVLRAGPDFVKVYLERSEEHAARASDPDFYGKRGLDPALLPRVVELARASGLRVSVHVSSAADFRTAVAAGADEIAHLPLERLTDADAEAAAAAGATVVTTFVSHRPTEGFPDAAGAMVDNVRRLHRAGVRLVLGTDSHRAVTDEMAELEAAGALDRGTLLRLAVVETPRWIFPDRRIGALEEGCEASFLVLRADPGEDLGALGRVELQVKQGHVLQVEPAPAGAARHP